MTLLPFVGGRLVLFWMSKFILRCVLSAREEKWTKFSFSLSCEVFHLFCSPSFPFPSNRHSTLLIIFPKILSKFLTVQRLGGAATKKHSTSLSAGSKHAWFSLLRSFYVPPKSWTFGFLHANVTPSVLPNMQFTPAFSCSLTLLTCSIQKCFHFSSSLDSFSMLVSCPFLPESPAVYQIATP